MATFFFDPSDYSTGSPGDDPLTAGADQWDESSVGADQLTTSEIKSDGDGQYWHMVGPNDSRQPILFSDVGSETALDIVAKFKGAGFRPTGGPFGFSDDNTPWLATVRLHHQ